MKRVLVFLVSLFLICTATQSKAQSADGWAAALDTLTNADSHSDTISVIGQKHCVSFQSNVIKISGTVAGSFSVYGSLDGTKFGTTALTTVSLSDATSNYLASYSFNGYKKYRIVTNTTGTSSVSVRHYYLYRTR